MKVYNAFGLVSDWWAAVKSATIPTLQDIFKNPRLLFAPRQLSRLFFSYVWKKFAPFVDEGGREVKRELILPNASGVVLDLGAGHGHTVYYLDRSRVTKYVALEPNQSMHEEIRKVAASAGFIEERGELMVLGYGAEDIENVISALGGDGQVDTIVSILTLCSVPQPRQTITNLVQRCLKPGGQLLYYEHVQSYLDDVQWWQTFWTPMWKLAFDGCCLDRPTHKWIEQAAKWDETQSRVFITPQPPSQASQQPVAKRQSERYGLQWFPVFPKN